MGDSTLGFLHCCKSISKALMKRPGDAIQMACVNCCRKKRTKKRWPTYLNTPAHRMMHSATLNTESGLLALTKNYHRNRCETAWKRHFTELFRNVRNTRFTVYVSMQCGATDACFGKLNQPLPPRKRCLTLLNSSVCKDAIHLNQTDNPPAAYAHSEANFPHTMAILYPPANQKNQTALNTDLEQCRLLDG